MVGHGFSRADNTQVDSRADQAQLPLLPRLARKFSSRNLGHPARSGATATYASFDFLPRALPILTKVLRKLEETQGRRNVQIPELLKSVQKGLGHSQD